MIFGCKLMPGFLMLVQPGYCSVCCVRENLTCPNYWSPLIHSFSILELIVNKYFLQLEIKLPLLVFAIGNPTDNSCHCFL
jgi:hypothetical protein